MTIEKQNPSLVDEVLQLLDRLGFSVQAARDDLTSLVHANDAVGRVDEESAAITRQLIVCETTVQDIDQIKLLSASRELERADGGRAGRASRHFARGNQLQRLRLEHLKLKAKHSRFIVNNKIQYESMSHSAFSVCRENVIASTIKRHGNVEI